MSVRVTFQRGKQYRQTFYQNDETPLEVTLRDSAGNPIDLTSLTLTLPAKLNLFDDTAAFTLTGTLTDAVNGVVTFPVTDAETGSIRAYYAEIHATDGAGYTEALILFQLDILRGIV